MSASNVATDDVSAAFAKAGAPAVAKLYEFNEGPAQALEALARFEKMGKSLIAQKRMRFCGLAILTVATLAVFIKTQNYNGWLVGLAWAFMLLSTAIRAIITWKRGTASKSFPLLAVPAIFFGGVTTLTLFADSSQQYSGLDQIKSFIAHLQGPTPASAIPATAFTTFLLALAVVLVPYGWISYWRFRRVIPQASEIYFCLTILRGLIKEVAPGARCKIACNPFPSEWSSFQGKTPGGKVAYFDSLLTARLGLGSGRTMSLAVMHRRSSKGRNKHKGWKHKVKIKYCLTSEEGFAIFAAEPNARKISEFVVNAAKAEKELTADWKFRETIGGQSDNPVTVGQKTVVLTQGFFNPCAFSADLSTKELPHPNLVLASIRGLCSGVHAVSGAPKPE